MSTTVSWQSAFFALVPMALNVMTQPYGRHILQFHGTGALLLRTSPILNALDSLTLLVQLASCMVGKARLPLRRACQRVLQNRLDDDDESEARLQRLQRLKHLTLTRWFVFVLGTGPQAVKLAVFKGTRWTLAWGLMFLGPFVVVEVVTALAAVTAQEADPERLVSEDLPDGSGETVTVVGWAGLMIQFGFLSWAFADILHLERFWEATRPLSDAIQCLMMLPIFSTACLFCLASLMIFGGVLTVVQNPLFKVIAYIPLVGPWARRVVAATKFAAEMISVVAACTVLVIVAWWCSAPLSVIFIFTVNFLTFIQVFLIIFVSVYALKCLYLKCWERLQEKLADLVLGDLADLGRGRLKGYIVLAVSVTCMLANVFTALIWYQARYDPTETERPAWTDKLG